jgi:hypothetical protein
MSDHGLRRQVDDRKVPWRVFAVIGVAVAALGFIYWAAAYEESGTVMLLVAAVLGLWIATFLWLRQPDEAEPVVEGEGETATSGAAVTTAAVEEHYLPHASVWPFAIGLGGAAVGVGIVLGLWVLVPGLGILALGLGGFVRQTRRRD